ncbi:hypothetical protein DICPUDRAFT_158103 [Dictyostelium purpureum]|uniref:HTTM-like domain-containing protein n=1 Tax=Dictyostelium purpureum TaxID=5786 RepID=F1A0U7_DICPU|nr:uncharacterized protein DICPUDRAFT_158103 [Dictyostelium purpureum]EGC30184.1 hypothetical protein DICPUDRAFT_158103 [Dictyostelium purpureum]|eukprot:XP_003293291.1 hypothetical protein DICPUDRAFT_158103 [Dictyostelium purpureum]
MGKIKNKNNSNNLKDNNNNINNINSNSLKDNNNNKKRNTLSYIKHKLTCMFGCDYRSMALFRVAMALCVIGDVIERGVDLRVMYTDEGIMPRHLIIQRYSSNYFYVVHLMNSSVHFQAILFSLHIFFALLMLIGYRTKTFSTLTWFMTISLQAYNGVVGHGGDVFFRCMLFINIFLPTAEYFSVDKATFYNEQPIGSSSPSRMNNSLTNNSISIASGNIDNEHNQPLLDSHNSANGASNPLNISIDSGLNTSGNGLLNNPGNSGSVVGESNIEIGLFEKEKESYSHHHRDPNSYRYLSFATACVLLQMGCMYVTSYFHKTGEEWRNGEATFYAITLDYFATDFAKLILHFRPIIRVLTIAVAKWELIGIFFIFSPVYTDWFRFFSALGFIAMHVGFVMCLRLGLFFWVTAGAQLINIPTPVWEIFFRWCERKILKGQRPPKVYYNTTSPFSQKLALAIKTFFIVPGTAYFSPLTHITQNENISLSTFHNINDNANNPINNNNTSDDDTDESDQQETSLSSRRRSSPNMNNKSSGSLNSSTSNYYNKELVGDDWLVSIDSNGIRKRNIHALNYILSKSPLLFPIAWCCKYVPNKLSDFWGKTIQLFHSRSQQNQVVSGKRSIYSKRKNPIPSFPRWCSVLNNIFMFFICWYILAYNCNTFKIDLGYNYNLSFIAYTFRLDQGWNMFSPAPPKTHWWHVIHGELEDGTKVELFKNEGIFNFNINTVVNFEKPNPFYKSYGNHRWFKYWENGYNQANSDSMRLEMGRYICRQFNNRHLGDEMLYKFSVYFVHEFQHLDGTVTAPQHQTLWNHVCYEK